FVIAECLARRALAERLITNWYAYDQRIHGELRQRVEGELQMHNAAAQMKQLSGKYSEIEFVKSANNNGKNIRGAQHVMQLSSSEWDEVVQKLAVTFDNSESQLSNAGNKSLSRPSRLARPARTPDQVLPVGKLSRLQEDESCYYAKRILSKTADRL